MRKSERKIARPEEIVTIFKFIISVLFKNFKNYTLANQQVLKLHIFIYSIRTALRTL